MIKLLAKIFIKNPNDYENAKVREQYGVLCGAFGVFLNIVLFGLKFIFGMIASSVAMMADAFNNLSDGGSSIVQIVGFKLASKKPDSEHPFGHGRIEYITGLFISFIILYMGIELIKSSISSIIHPEVVNFSIFSVVVMIISILIKLYMYLYNHLIAKKISSVSMEATAKDSLSDTISTSVVILAIIAGRFVDWPVDGIGGVIVGIFIIKTGLESVHDTIEPLLGVAPSKEFVEQIEEELMEHKPICGMHDLVVHDYGPGRRMLSLHAEVPGDMNIFELHDVIDVAEVSIAQKFNCHVVIHMDPVDTKNERLAELKTVVKKVLEEIDSELKAHDIRMVPGVTHTNLIFDVVKPFSVNIKDNELSKMIAERIHSAENDVYCVITVENSYV